MVIPNADAYSRPEPSYDSSLTEVGRGTPMGEYLRRYWHPVGLKSYATTTPRKVRIFGEDLILFRDGQGRPGLLYPRCCHRGTSLYYGRCEGGGIRCCYHGWLFDVEGHCLDMPMEPRGGEAARRHVRQPWYPVEERYGLIFAYMGPPDKQPLLPRYQVLEGLEDGEFIDTDDSNLGSGGVGIAPCNWLQHYENVADPFHVPILHGAFSGTQFVPEMAVTPDVEFEYWECGVRTHQRRDLEDGRHLHRVTECLLPTIRVVPSPRLQSGRSHSLGFTLPVDDAHYTIFTAARVTEASILGKQRSKPGGMNWPEMSETDHRDFPGDWEAQTGQGKITFHSEENLVSSDRGILMLRQLYNDQIEVIQAGGDPVGWTQTPGCELIDSAAGNFYGDEQH